MSKEGGRAWWVHVLILAVLALTSGLWACSPASRGTGNERVSGTGKEAGASLGSTAAGESETLAMTQFAESPADFIRQPRFFGAKTAPMSIIVYTNPQCPPCKRLSETLLEVFPRLDPAKTQVIVQGHGFFEQGTRLLYTAALLARQNQAMAVAFLGEAMRAGAAPYVDGDAWLRHWLERSGFAATFDEGAYLELAVSEDLGRAYADGVLAVRERYGLTSTPSLVINGKLYKGERTVDGILRAVNAQ